MFPSRPPGFFRRLFLLLRTRCSGCLRGELLLFIPCGDSRVSPLRLRPAVKTAHHVGREVWYRQTDASAHSKGLHERTVVTYGMQEAAAEKLDLALRKAIKEREAATVS